MDQAVATQDHIGARKFVTGEVKPQALRFVVAVKFAVACDEIGNDVCANVLLEVKLRVFHPVEVTARSVEKSAHPALLQQTGQLASQFCGARKAGSRS